MVMQAALPLSGPALEANERTEEHNPAIKRTQEPLMETVPEAEHLCAATKYTRVVASSRTLVSVPFLRTCNAASHLLLERCKVLPEFLLHTDHAFRILHALALIGSQDAPFDFGVRHAVEC